MPLLALVVFHAMEYGAEVSADPTFAPSSMNCTLVTPRLSAAFAETVIVPDTVALRTGEVMDTVGGVVSVVLFVAKTKSPLIDSTPPEFFECTR